MKFLLTMSLCLATMFTMAQQKSIQGIVKDDGGIPIPGANVLVKGTNQGAMTDFDGRYVLKSVKPEDVIVFSYIGMETYEVQVKNQDEIDVTLKKGIQELDEVVLVGYGSVKKSDLTGAVGSVRLKGIQETGINTLSGVLDGRTTGVQVSGSSGLPGAETDVVIRGRSSMSTNSAPLYVVDGIILDPTMPSAGFTTPVNPLQDLTPSDIKSIEVLKDASATAIYGSRGANGVVLVTTKQGEKGKGKVFIQTFTSFSEVLNKVDVLDPYTYAEAVNFGQINFDNQTEGRFPADEITGAIKRDSLVTFNWQDEYYKTAVTNSYRAGVSGGNDNSTYYFALGYLDSDGVIKGTGMEKYDFRVNNTFDVNNSLKLSSVINASKVDNHFTQGSGSDDKGKFSIINSMIQSSPAFVKGDDFLTSGDDGGIGSDENNVSTPKAWVEESEDEIVTNTLNAAFVADLELSKSFKFRSRIGLNYRNSKRQVFFSENHNRGRGSGGEGNRINNAAISYNLDNLLMYNKQFKKGHKIYGTAGMTYFKNQQESEHYRATNFPDGSQKGDAMNAGAVASIVNSSKSKYSYLSYLTRIVYNWKERFLLTGTFRADGVSKFATGNQWGYFPSASVAYNLHKESFIKDVDFISQMKLRLGWGQVGNSSTPVFATQNQFTYNVATDANGNLVTGIVPSVKGNPDLTWEISEQTNIGIDFGFFKNRLTATVDAYYKTTNDQLQSIALPASAGFSNWWVNLGKVENKGIELALNAYVIDSPEWKLNLGGNISFNRNKVLEVGKDVDEFGLERYAGPRVNDFILNAPLNMFIEGQPIGVFWGYKTDGIIQEGEADEAPAFSGITLEPGDIRFVDSRGGGDDLREPDGNVTTLDQTIIGDPNPDFVYSFFGDVSYKKLSLSFQFSGSKGNQVFDGTGKLSSDISSTLGLNVIADAYLNAWTPENQSNEYPRYGYNGSTTFSQMLDRDIKDGSYLKLQNITLGYTFNMPNSGIDSIRVYLTGQNLIYITGYDGMTSEIGRSGNGLFGADYNRFPNAKSYQLGININL